MADHPVWWLLTAACLLWYSSITLFVAFKGMKDITTMLRRLKEGSNGQESHE